MRSSFIYPVLYQSLQSNFDASTRKEINFNVGCSLCSITVSNQNQKSIITQNIFKCHQSLSPSNFINKKKGKKTKTKKMLSEKEKSKRRLMSYGMFAAATSLYLVKDITYFNAPMYPLFFNTAAAYFQTGTLDE